MSCLCGKPSYLASSFLLFDAICGGLKLWPWADKQSHFGSSWLRSVCLGCANLAPEVSLSLCLNPLSVTGYISGGSIQIQAITTPCLDNWNRLMFLPFCVFVHFSLL